jgi:hypothetical protein
MLDISQTTQFKRDIRKLRWQGKKLEELMKIIETLVAGETLASSYHDHTLLTLLCRHLFPPMDNFFSASVFVARYKKVTHKLR